MGVISGVNGSVNGKSVVEEWKIRTASNPTDVGITDAETRVAGNTDWTGFYRAYGYLPEVLPGDSFTFLGGIGKPTTDTGAYSGTNETIVESAEIRWDIEAGKLIEHTVDFASNGTLTIGTAAPTKGNTMNLFKSIGTKLSICTAGGSYADLDGIQNMRLRLTRKLHSYAASNTGGKVKRIPLKLDAEFSFSIYTDDFAVIPVAGNCYWVKAYVTAALFWEIKSLYVSDAGDMGPDIETGAPVVVPVTMNFSAYYELPAGTWTKGSIFKPGAAQWWPVV